MPMLVLLPIVFIIYLYYLFFYAWFQLMLKAFVYYSYILLVLILFKYALLYLGKRYLCYAFTSLAFYRVLFYIYITCFIRFSCLISSYVIGFYLLFLYSSCAYSLLICCIISRKKVFMLCLVLLGFL